MSKRIIFCADGTWDSPESTTNVYKLFKAIPLTSGQVSFYDDGVGSDGTAIDKLVGGAFGNGLFQKIKDGYTKISHVYEQGDEIFIFGFSRGAFTARSLAGMIAVCGLPTGKFDDSLVETAFNAYRDQTKRSALLASLSSASLFDAKITMIGVWDTVGALGIPALFGGVDPLMYGFLNTGLHVDVLNAYQALAINERRQEFPPTLWTLPNPPYPGQVLEQVWFSGVHCDIGGGYPETGLSDIPLSWMMGKASALGLIFDPALWPKLSCPDAKNALDVLHESWSLMWLFPKSRAIPSDATLGNSVGIRYAYGSPTYQPGNLSVNNKALASSYKIVDVVASPSA